MGGRYHFEKLCYFSPFRIYALWAPAVPGHLILTSEEKVHQNVYSIFIISMRPPGDEMSRFLPKIWMLLALLAGDQQCFGRWGAGVQISRCYYKVLVLIPFYQVYTTICELLISRRCLHLQNLLF